MDKEIKTMDKTQVTPIQELIALYEENITGDSNDLVIKACINVAKRLLPTERQFAETFYDKGRKYGNNYDDRNAFDNEFKKYTHD